MWCCHDSYAVEGIELVTFFSEVSSAAIMLE